MAPAASCGYDDIGLAAAPTAPESLWRYRHWPMTSESYLSLAGRTRGPRIFFSAPSSHAHERTTWNPKISPFPRFRHQPTLTYLRLAHGAKHNRGTPQPWRSPHSAWRGSSSLGPLACDGHTPGWRKHRNRRGRRPSGTRPQPSRSSLGGRSTRVSGARSMSLRRW